MFTDGANAVQNLKPQKKRRTQRKPKIYLGFPLWNSVLSVSSVVQDLGFDTQPIWD